MDTSASVLVAAADLALQRFNLWDAVILCAAAEAGCHLLLSEDMQPGFRWRGLTVVNPFADRRDPLLETLRRP